jgi:hypothetical protein
VPPHRSCPTKQHSAPATARASAFVLTAFQDVNAVNSRLRNQQARLQIPGYGTVSPDGARSFRLVPLRPRIRVNANAAGLDDPEPAGDRLGVQHAQ